MTRCLLIAVLVAGMSTGSASAQDPAEAAFAKAFLSALQDRSFDRNREFCGYFGIAPDGSFGATKVRRGGADSCRPRGPGHGLDVTASFHTHGGYDPEYDNEVPSVDDVEGDMADGVGGYVATPGGRLWFIDGDLGVARLICGPGCIPSDPDFVPEPAGSVAARYDLEELAARAETWN